MITKVRQLTGMNIYALEYTMLGKKLGATYAEFEGSPVQALAAVEQVMTARGVNANYRSLMAVRRKLAKAAARWDAIKHEDGAQLALTPYVNVIR